MRLTARLSLSLILGVAAVSLAIAAYQTAAQTRGMRRDLQRQSQMFAESLAPAAEPLVAKRAYPELQKLVERFQHNQSVAGIGVLDATGQPLASTPGFTALFSGMFRGMSGGVPPAVTGVLDNGWPHVEFVPTNTGTLHV